MARGTNQSARRFGVEIEAYNVDRFALSAKLTAAGVRCNVEGYNHDQRSHWKIVSDGSLYGSQAFELVSPPLSGAAGLAQLRIACTVLNEMGARVNKSCGLHVHVDATDLTLADYKALVHNFIRYEGCFDLLVSPSRRANHYAQSTRGRFATVAEGARKIDACNTVHDLRSVNRMDRYHKLNLEAQARHGTVEFRQHQGTTDYAKMESWIGLVVGFVEKARSTARTNRTTIRGANGIRDFLKCAPVGVRPYLLARYQSFKAQVDREDHSSHVHADARDVTVSGTSIEVARATILRGLADARAAAARASLRRATAQAISAGAASPLLSAAQRAARTAAPTNLTEIGF